MKMCIEHWDGLKAAIEARGLNGYISANGDELANKMQNSIIEGESISTFDPLMGAHNAIIGFAASFDSAILLFDGCPLCFANDMHNKYCTYESCRDEHYFDKFIENAADDQLKLAQSLRG